MLRFHHNHEMNMLNHQNFPRGIGAIALVRFPPTQPENIIESNALAVAKTPVAPISTPSANACQAPFPNLETAPTVLPLARPNVNVSLIFFFQFLSTGTQLNALKNSVAFPTALSWLLL